MQAANDTVTVVEEIELDPHRLRTKQRNPKDTSWQRCESLSQCRLSQNAQPANLIAALEPHQVCTKHEILKVF